MICFTNVLLFISGGSPDSGVTDQSSLPKQSASSETGEDEPLGPLPTNWEKAYTEKGEPYFIDHSTGKNRFYIDIILVRRGKFPSTYYSCTLLYCIDLI